MVALCGFCLAAYVYGGAPSCGCWRASFFFFKQKTAYEMRISDWSSDVCSSDLLPDVDVLRLAPVEVVQEENGPDHRQGRIDVPHLVLPDMQIGRASCREGVCQYV